MYKALVTGITGQDGSYLAGFSFGKGYEVHSTVCRASLPNTSKTDHLIAKKAVTLHYGDLSDQSSVVRIINMVRPDEIYNLAAQSMVDSAVVFELKRKEYTNIITKIHAGLTAKVIGYKGKILWNTTKLNGTPRKLLDVSKAAKLGWRYKTKIEDGLRLAYEDFLNNPVRVER